MATERYVIIGNGAAANAAADQLRREDLCSPITMISDEAFPFYYRHKLRDYVTGLVEEGDLTVRSSDHYTQQKLRLRLGQRVVRLSLTERTLYLAHMEKVHYTKLLICTGGKPRIPEPLQAHQQHLTCLKTLADARVFREKLEQVEQVLLVGGDMVSVRVAARLVEARKKVTFLIDRDSFWPLELTDERHAELVKSLDKRGIQVLEGDRITHIEAPEPQRLVVSIGQGDTLECGLIGAFFGLVPAVDFLLGSGLDIERGVLVDDHLQASDPHVYAAGDCAQIYNPDIRNYWVSIGWPNAERLGRCAASNMLGAAHKAVEPPQKALSVEGIKVCSPWWREF